MHHRRPRALLRATLTGLAGLLTVGLVAGTLPAAPAAAAKATRTVQAEPAPASVYGSTDPTYDGVFRHALAVLALRAAGREVPAPAVRWLLDQQCADGSFPPYRASTAGACPPYDPATWAGGTDTNATALAAQALLAVGRTAEARRAAERLRDLQQPDGGWELVPGAGYGTDPNSTALVLTALHAHGLTPRHDAVGFLAGLQVGRTLPALSAEDEGGIATPFSGGAPNVLATVQVAPAVLGANLVRLPKPSADGWDDAARTVAGTPPATAAGVGGWAARWLAQELEADRIGTGDVAWAVLGLAADGTGEDAARRGYARLRAETLDMWTNPGALAEATLAALVLGRGGDAARYTQLLGDLLAKPATATLTSPRRKATRARARMLTGRAVAGTAPADQVCVRVAQRRKKGGWYSFQGTGWKKRKGGAAAITKAPLRCVDVKGSTWSTRVRGVRKGTLVVRWFATDERAGRSATTQRTVRVRR